MKKVIKINKRLSSVFEDHFKVGFECEYVHLGGEESYTNLLNELRDIHPRMMLDTDCSIEPSDDDYDDYNFDGAWMGYEIKTPPLVPLQSLEVLGHTFEVIKKYGYTNKTCGLHASFSPMSDQIYASINPMKVFNNPLWTKMKQDFDRIDNDYCSRTPWNNDGEERKRMEKNLTPLKRMEKNLTPLERFIGIRDGEDINFEYSEDDFNEYDGHCSEVNFNNYDKVRNNMSRIEIRCMGNKDYEKKFPLVARHVHNTIKVLKSSYPVKF